MGFYRISSQLTDYILSRSTPSAAEKYFEQIVEAFERLAETGSLTWDRARLLESFHANPKLNISDEEMLSKLPGTEEKKVRELNNMYKVLGGMERSGQLNIRTRKVLERFLESAWRPWSEAETIPEPVVMRGRRKEPTVVPEIEEKEQIPFWERGEERLLEDIERKNKKAAEFIYELATHAGILERVPDFKERLIRLAERKFAWTTLLSFGVGLFKKAEPEELGLRWPEGEEEEEESPIEGLEPGDEDLIETATTKELENFIRYRPTGPNEEAMMELARRELKRRKEGWHGRTPPIRMAERKFAWTTLLSFGQGKPNLYFLIGPPAVGKSTWIKTNAAGATVANRDEEVIAAAKETGVGTYDDMFTRPPSDLLESSGLSVPPKEVVAAAAEGDEQARAQVDQFLSALPAIAENHKATADPATLQQFGDIVPFDFDTLKQVVVDFGVPVQYITPFEFGNIKSAEELVAQKFDEVRRQAVEGGGDIVIDMTNMNQASRDSHRKFLVAAKEGTDPGSADPQKVNDYYNQVAIVFAPEGGYSEDDKAKLKQVAHMRAEEIKAEGGAKTIPDQAYDRMFDSYEPPTDAEGFTQIEYVGIPSLGKLE